jgi:hypothetical protein
VQSREQLQRVAPVDLAGKELIARKLAREPLIQRRLAREVARLKLERLAPVQAWSAAFA